MFEMKAAAFMLTSCLFLCFLGIFWSELSNFAVCIFVWSSLATFQASSVWFQEWATRHSELQQNVRRKKTPINTSGPSFEDNQSVHSDFSEFKETISRRASLADEELDKNVANLVNQFFSDFSREVTLI